MKTHIIENNVVINTIMATVEEAQHAYPNHVCIDAGDKEGGIGWTWNGSSLVAPVVVLTDEQKWANIRFQRDALLLQSDVYVLPDRWASYSAEKQKAWSDYRQALRDIPQTYANPDSVVWPTMPA